MPKENFPWEAIAVIGRVLEENSHKYQPANWRDVSVEVHCEHAKDHLKSILHFANPEYSRLFRNEDLENAFVRLAMAVVVDQAERHSRVLSKSMNYVYNDDDDDDGYAVGPDGGAGYIRKKPLWHDDWF